MQQSTLKPPKPQSLNYDISAFLRLIFLQHTCSEAHFMGNYFFGNTFSQRLLLGAKQLRILPLDLSLKYEPFTRV